MKKKFDYRLRITENSSLEKADDPQMNGYDARTRIYESQIRFYESQIKNSSIGEGPMIHKSPSVMHKSISMGHKRESMMHKPKIRRTKWG